MFKELEVEVLEDIEILMVLNLLVEAVHLKVL